MPTPLAEPVEYQRFGLRVQRTGREQWRLRELRGSLEAEALRLSGRIDILAAYEIALIIEFSGSILRLGAMLKAGADSLPVGERLDLERLRLYAVRERGAAIRRLFSGRSAKQPDGSAGDALASILDGMADDLTPARSLASGATPSDVGGHDA